MKQKKKASDFQGFDLMKFHILMAYKVVFARHDLIHNRSIWNG